MVVPRPKALFMPQAAQLETPANLAARHVKLKMPIIFGLIPGSELGDAFLGGTFCKRRGGEHVQ